MAIFVLEPSQGAPNTRSQVNGSPRLACCVGQCRGSPPAGITVERMFSDNGSAYKSHAWRDAYAELNIRPKKNRPYRPQTTGRSNVSTAPSPNGGPSNGSTPQNQLASTRSRPGSTNTITTDPHWTQSEASRP